MSTLKRSSYLFFLILILAIPVIADNSLRISDEDVRLTMEITDGYYTDYDEDGKEDDVIVEYSFKLKFDKDMWSYKIRMDLDLELPSGYTFSYSYYIKFQGNFREDSTHKIELRVIFWDHAIESGWYTIFTGVSNFEDYDTASLSFDPPENPIEGAPPPPSFETMD